MFRERFLTNQFYLQKKEEFIHFEQGAQSVDECYSKFVHLLKFNKAYDMDESMKIHKFLLGLETKIRICVAMHEPKAILKVVDLAQKEVHMVEKKIFVENYRNNKNKIKLRIINQIMTIGRRNVVLDICVG